MSSPTSKHLREYLPKPLRYRLHQLKLRWVRSLSQFGQDFWVFGEVFNEKRNGFFLDIGAAGGESISNTFLLEKRYGWRGICIEANPQAYHELVRVRSAHCLNCCVDEKDGQVEFLQNGLLSGIVDASTDLRAELGKNSGTIKLKTRPLKTILEEFQAPETIDYMSIDIEGAEERVLMSFPFSKYRFLCMTIERPKPILRDLLHKNGYVLVKEIPGYDCFYLHESFIPEYQNNIIQFWIRHRT